MKSPIGSPCAGSNPQTCFVWPKICSKIWRLLKNCWLFLKELDISQYWACIVVDQSCVVPVAFRWGKNSLVHHRRHQSFMPPHHWGPILVTIYHLTFPVVIHIVGKYIYIFVPKSLIKVRQKRHIERTTYIRKMTSRLQGGYLPCGHLSVQSLA